MATDTGTDPLVSADALELIAVYTGEPDAARAHALVASVLDHPAGQHVFLVRKTIGFIGESWRDECAAATYPVVRAGMAERLAAVLQIEEELAIHGATDACLNADFYLMLMPQADDRLMLHIFAALSATIGELLYAPGTLGPLLREAAARNRGAA